MAKSKRRYTPSTGGGARPDAQRRSFRPTDPGSPPPMRPPVGSAGARPIGAPRPLTPATSAKTGALAAFGTQRLVIGVVGLVVLAAVGLLLFAWWDNTIKPRNELAVRVGDRSYDMEYFAKRFRTTVENPPPGTNIRTSLLTTLPERTREKIETESITLQRAGSLGVTASANEIDRDLVVKKLGIPVLTPGDDAAQTVPTAPFTVTPAIDATLRSQLRREDLTLAEYRRISEADTLRQKVLAYFTDQAPKRGPQARVRLLQVPNESDARIAIAKIKSGESTLAELADTVSLDTAGKGRGGLRDWLPKGILGTALDNAVFSLPVGQLSEPIDSGLENAWFVIQVEERSDERDITDDVRRQLGQKASDDWYAQQRAELGVTNAITEKKIRWAFDRYPPNLTGASGAGGLPSGLPGGLPGGLQVPIPQPAPGGAPAQPPAGGTP